MENQMKEMTPIEALEGTIKVLNSVMLPRNMTIKEAAPILTPVTAAIGNLEVIIEAIRAAEEQEGKANG